ncbi:MAG: RIO1 family regulatory kinase/ATPase [Candidatus Nanohaloarchaea archaeon]
MVEDDEMYPRRKEKKRQMFDSSEARKAVENVLDDDTMNALLKAADRNLIDRMHGIIESGKESAILLADTSEGLAAVKIYMKRAGAFREMHQYLRGDKRFRNVKKDRKAVVDAWAKKEFKNLNKASDIVRCPGVYGLQENVLVMEFIGEDFRPYPKLKDVNIENPDLALEQTLNQIKALWDQEDLVHGDLSEYNILVEKDELVWVDFSQRVHESHPEAVELLERDVENVVYFFRKQGAEMSLEEALNLVIPGR